MFVFLILISKEDKMQIEIQREGKCHCGAISYIIEGKEVYHSLCHCSDCRRWSGAPMVGWIAFKKNQIKISGKPLSYASSKNGTREFCGNCGTGLFYRNEVLLPGLIDVHSGTLNDLSSNPPDSQVMVKERVSWLDHFEKLPKFNSYPGKD
jgi:hypothetical protein